jgi:hypothetical protein
VSEAAGGELLFEKGGAGRVRAIVVIGVLLLCLSAVAEAGDGLVGAYETGDREFIEVEIADRFIVYYHQRMTGEAFVEGDFIVYRFEAGTRELLEKTSHWRDDLPEEPPPSLLSASDAGALVGGDVEFARLWYIAPDSDVCPLDPAPTNPCWVVRSTDERGYPMIGIVDAVTGDYLGEGVPPPYAGFSITGPIEFQPCQDGWYSWAGNARSWFDTMGYPTEYVVWPSNEEFRGHVQSTETAVIYEIAHSDDYVGYAFESGCVGGEHMEIVTAAAVRSWITDYESVPFTFLASCYGMCETDYNRLSYEFRKGVKDGTATIGYCGMSDPICDTCWWYSLDWQDALFGYLNEGYTIGDAFAMANADYPMCAGPSCMKHVGGGIMTLVPPIPRVTVDRLVPDEYPTIQSAIDAANRGDVIKVAMGTYVEGLALPGYTTLVGGYDPTFTDRDPVAYPTVVDGGGAGHVIACENGDHTLVDGFVVRNAGPSSYGIYLGHAEAAIRNCDVGGCWVGIAVEYEHGTPAEGIPVVERCTLCGNTGVGILVSHSGHDAVEVMWNVVAGNGGAGIVSVDSPTRMVHNTIVENEGSGGIEITGGEAVVKSNIVALNLGHGILCASGDPVIDHNDIWENTVGGYVGCAAGPHDIALDPVFCDLPGGDLSVHASSPVLGAGEYGEDIGALGVGCPVGPQDLDIAQVGASLELSWSAPPWARTSVDQYFVYRDTTSVPTEPITSVAGADTTFVDTTVAPCEAFNYWVTAVDTDSLEGALSNRVSGELCYAGPANVVATFSEGENGVAWIGAEGPVAYYVIMRGNEEADPDSIAAVAAPETTYVDDTSDDCPRDSYRYQILPVYDTSWRGVVSNEASVDPRPAAPQGLLAEWSADDVILTWNPNCESDFRRYWVYRDTVPIAPPVNSELLIGFTPDTTYVDVGLDPGGTYFYRIAASDKASQKSGYSGMAWIGTGEVLGVPSPFGTIQAAIDVASALDTVLVAPGTYSENITLKDGVAVVSAGGREVTAIQSSSGTIVTANSLSDLALLRGFTVDGMGSALIGLNAWGSYLVVEDCALVHLNSGAAVQYGGAPSFLGNTFASNQMGLAAADSAAPSVLSNTFEGNALAGVYADCDAGLRIGGALADANDFVDMGAYHVYNHSAAEVDARQNYWGDICPQAGWFEGPVDYVPWTDESHSGLYEDCTGVPEWNGERAYAGENFPNPFNPSTAIRYAVPPPGGPVRIEIYDLTGRTVRTLVDEEKGAGTYLAVWRGRDDHGRMLGSGVYFYRVEIGEYRVERKMVLLK